MASRKLLTEKSKPFTTINLYLPVKISICGTPEMQRKWNLYFKNKNSPDKAEFILENFRRDYNVKSNAELFDDVDSKRWDKKKIEGLLIELGFPNIQMYINMCLDRVIEEKNNENI